MLAHLGTMLGLGWVLLSCLGPMLGLVGLSLAHLGTMLPPRGCFGPMFTLFWVYVGPSWNYVGTMLGFVGSNAAPRDAAICQSCSCWCSCCASGCSCFCSRCLRGCCAVEVVDVLGAVLCKWMQRPNTRQTGPPHSPTPSSPTPPLSRGGKRI